MRALEKLLGTSFDACLTSLDPGMRRWCASVELCSCCRACFCEKSRPFSPPMSVLVSLISPAMSPPTPAFWRSCCPQDDVAWTRIYDVEYRNGFTGPRGQAWKERADLDTSVLFHGLSLLDPDRDTVWGECGGGGGGGGLGMCLGEGGGGGCLPAPKIEAFAGSPSTAKF